MAENILNKLVNNSQIAIDDGKAMKLLEKFVADTGDIKKLKEITNG